MSTVPEKPTLKPANPCFSSGPCAKRPGWTLAALDASMAGRSHRAAPAKAQLQQVIDRHKALLDIPADYHVGIVPASDTGAVEMAMWSLLGARGVDIFAWEAFSTDWLKDATSQLKLQDLRVFEAPYGELPDLTQYDGGRDVVFVWNGTTSGVRVPDGDWIPADRQGLSICDATSAVFAYEMPWDKLDVVTWSWQKVLGSEAAHGMLVLSPRAVARLESYKPSWPLPKIFRMTNKGKFSAGIFAAETINTPSMLAVADCLDALQWVESIGGRAAAIARSRQSLQHIRDWVDASDWIAFLPAREDLQSSTSVCLKITDPWLLAQPEDAQLPFVKDMLKPLDKEKVAHDIASYRTAPAGIRIWCGATVEPNDVALLLPWLTWAYASAKAARA
ncbi:MAG: phosphoserine transaminase [Bryobacterales bacterium]|jgi:phosphoserine aminotransferase|nr:phosphoserine transaminase [Bryobacterales bacterium]